MWIADALLGPGTQGDFEANIRKTLEYVRANIRKCSQPLPTWFGLKKVQPWYAANTLVNLFGVFQVSQIYNVGNIKANCYEMLKLFDLLHKVNSQPTILVRSYSFCTQPSLIAL